MTYTRSMLSSRTGFIIVLPIIILGGMTAFSYRVTASFHVDQAGAIAFNGADQETPSVRIHPRFGLSEEDLRDMENLPLEALNNPEAFLERIIPLLSVPDDRLLLVDKQNPIGEEDDPSNLVDLSDFPDITVARSNLLLTEDSAQALQSLCRAAQEDGVTLIVASAYRSYDYQRGLFASYSARYGEEAANRFSARAGQSQHQLGTVVDFHDITNDFADTEAGQWMAQKGNDFGWSLSFPLGREEVTGYQWESWHWRWLGVEATAMESLYFVDQQTFLVFWQKNASRLREAFESMDED